MEHEAQGIATAVDMAAAHEVLNEHSFDLSMVEYVWVFIGNEVQPHSLILLLVLPSYTCPLCGEFCALGGACIHRLYH